VTIGITGASGLVGARLLEVLLRDGEHVMAFSREPARLAPRLPRGADARAWPPREPDAVALDAIVHLLGEPVAGRWTEAKKRAIEASRVEGTRTLVDAIAQLPAERRPRVLVSASAIGYYGDRGDEVLTEPAPPGDDFLARVCVGWEREALRAETLGVRVVCLRIGLVMSREGGALERMLPVFRMGLGGTMGPGTQWWPWIHVDDVVGIVRHALTRDAVRGPLNATAPEPVRQRSFAATLAKVLRRPAFLPAPALALRTVLGEFAAELLASRRVVPEAARAFGYAFRFPTLEACLADVAVRSPH
jgi:uncharacterized protein (TIGR01777 family)